MSRLSPFGKIHDGAEERDHCDEKEKGREKERKRDGQREREEKRFQRNYERKTDEKVQRKTAFIRFSFVKRIQDSDYIFIIEIYYNIVSCMFCKFIDFIFIWILKFVFV